MKSITTMHIVIAAAAALAVGGIIGYSIATNSGLERPAKNFEECAAAGNPIMESYPRQCRANGQTFVEDIGKPMPVEPDGGIGDTPSGGCMPAGCSGQVCAPSDQAGEIVTTCEYRAEYACYRNAECERQPNGDCGWTMTAALRTCLASPPPVQ